VSQGRGYPWQRPRQKIIDAIFKDASKTALNSGSLKDVGDNLEGQIKDKASKITGLLKEFK
jgi:hypothetical protein